MRQISMAETFTISGCLEYNVLTTREFVIKSENAGASSAFWCSASAFILGSTLIHPIVGLAAAFALYPWIERYSQRNHSDYKKLRGDFEYAYA